MREMILASDTAAREKALAKALPFRRQTSRACSVS
jgi:hypothetical protein